MMTKVKGKCMTISRPVWAEVQLEHLAHNMREVRRVTKKEAIISAVIKADGYGHGALQIAQTLLDNGADRFAVATLSEAIQLKRAYPNVDIMVMGYTPDHLVAEALAYDIILCVYSYAQALQFESIATGLKKCLKVHIKIDTGMRRIGMAVTDQTILDILSINACSVIEVEGIFTHFAVADEQDKSFTHEQVKRFNFITKGLEAAGLSIPIKHVANSAAIIDCPEYHFDMVRAGIMLYGLYPSMDVDHNRVHLKPVMSLRVQIAQVKEVSSGEGISYGLKYKPEVATNIATLPIGYADGFTRSLSFKANGIIHGQIRPIVGRICMDQCMMDLKAIEAKVGDVVTLFGSDGKAQISIDEVAAQLETINYEIVCMVGKRVPRMYMMGDQHIAFEDFILR